MSARRSVLAHNLPVQLTTFVGRAREKAELKRLLAAARLVTLTGSGGAGKTRLALETARDVLDQFPDGVYLAELAPLFDPALVPRAIAAATGFRDESDRPLLDAVTAYLGGKRLLLLLDNCEHLIEACAQIADVLLRTCPELRILATSREPLGIAGETTWTVPPLSLPDRDRRLPLARVAEYEAPLLFMQRAAAVAPSFAVTEHTASILGEVCHRLDGIPLAIELAAAHVKGLSLGQIAARLDDRFRLLTRGSRTALPRQQTLRATMDWSHQLLSEPERVLLRRLAVFAGGFSLEAAEAVCPGDALDRPHVLPTLLTLVDKSLVMADERGGAIRYRLLQTVRQYARDRLDEVGERAAFERRHLDWYLTLAEQADARIRGPEQAGWLDRLQLDYDNLRAALDCSRGQHGSAGAELRLVSAVWWFCFARGHWSEARGWLETALARVSDAPAHVVPYALHAAAFFAMRQGDLTRASDLSSWGLALCAELGDRENRLWHLTWLGVVAVRHGRHDEAERFFDEGVALAQELGNDWFLGLLLSQLGIGALGVGARDRAIALHTRCLALARATGDTLMIAYQLRNLGVDCIADRAYDRAETYYLEALRLCREIGERWISEGCLEGLAAVACARGDYRRASRLFGAGEALRMLTGDSRFLATASVYAEHVAAARTTLGDVEFSALWADGQALGVADAIAYALGADAPPPAVDVPPSSTAAPAKGSEPLTPREREVAVLVSFGVSNRQIAARLHISERTAQTHVQHILDKLEFTSRAQIAAWAVQRGLVPSSN